MYENIKNRLLALAVAMDNPSLSDSIPLLSSTLQSLASSCSAHFGLSSAVDAISQLQQQITRLTNINYSSTETALRTLAQTPDYLLNTISLSSSTACQNLCDSLSMALERAGPHLPQDEKERCETIIKSQVAEKPCPHLTLSDALSILSILLSILFFVFESIPDDQAERIIQQQSKIIANQEAEIAQLHKEDQALLDALDSLSGSINLLTNEIELLRDELEDFDAFPDVQNQTDAGDPQQDSSNTQK